MNTRTKLITLFMIVVVMGALVACGGNNSPAGNSNNGSNGNTADEETLVAGDPAAGEELFNQVCIACHGPGGIGIEGLGKDMTSSEFIAGLSDAELLSFVKTGRPIGDPLNTTGVDMPPKGGNPALTDEQITDIIAYIRTIQN